MTVGLLVPGTIDPYNRPKVQNPDGSYSTLRTITIDDGGRTVLLPTVINGRIVTPQEAVQHYRQTGEYLGIFDTEDHANIYDRAMHDQIAPGSYDRRPSMPRGGPNEFEPGFPGTPEIDPGPIDTAVPENPRLPAAGVPIPGSQFGLSPDEFAALVAQYRQNRFGGGSMSQPGQMISPQQVLGPQMYDRIAKPPTGFGAVVPPIAEGLQAQQQSGTPQGFPETAQAPSLIQRKLRAMNLGGDRG